MAQADIEKKMEVSKEKLFEVVTRYEDYPQFVDGCKKVEVQRKGPGKARVTYHVSLIKDISYTLDHEEDLETGSIKWSLVESDFLKKNTGSWKIGASGEMESDVRYEIDIEFGIPVPGLILRKLVKGSLPAMIKNFEKRARS